VNIEYIYYLVSNPTLKKDNFFFWEHRVYIRKGFKSHIEKILCYPFKLKYLNQKVFLSHIEKNNIFLGNIEYIYTNGFQIPHLKKKKTGSWPGLASVARVTG